MANESDAIEVVLDKVHERFRDASRFAKGLALVFREEILVRRGVSGWEVLAPSWIGYYIEMEAYARGLSSDGIPESEMHNSFEEWVDQQDPPHGGPWVDDDEEN